MFLPDEAAVRRILRPDCRSGFSRNAENRLPGEVNCLPRSITAGWRLTIDGCSTFWRISGDQHKRRRPNVIFGNGLRKLRFERKKSPTPGPTRPESQRGLDEF